MKCLKQFFPSLLQTGSSGWWCSVWNCFWISRFNNWSGLNFNFRSGENFLGDGDCFLGDWECLRGDCADFLDDEHLFLADKINLHFTPGPGEIYLFGEFYVDLRSGDGDETFIIYLTLSILFFLGLEFSSLKLSYYYLISFYRRLFYSFNGNRSSLNLSSAQF